MENQNESKSPQRTVDQIRAEYSQLCAKAGHMQYQLYTLEKDLGIINGTLRDLNVEAATVSQKEASAKASSSAESEASAVSEAKES
jgi:hypothetical protein